MARALDRVNEISVYKRARVNLSRVPVNRLATLAHGLRPLRDPAARDDQ
jgi:hypothetical protein